MIISQLIGGLGNQMFEYAAAYVAAKHTGTELKVDNLHYNDQSKRLSLFTYRPYSLGIFNISGRIASPKEIKRFTYPRNQNKYIYHLMRHLHSDYNVFDDTAIQDYSALISLPSDCYLRGSFQKFDYFCSELNDIMKEFSYKNSTPRDQETASLISSSINSVCIHFRRGDYIGHPFMDVISVNYYYKALELLNLQSTTIFCFSDDIAWVRQNFAPPLPSHCSIVYVTPKYEDPLGGDDMQLMRLCKHFIIPNSTYSYWAALLSNTTPEKIVIAPKVWYKGQNPNIRNNILPPQWIAI